MLWVLPTRMTDRDVSSHHLLTAASLASLLILRHRSPRSSLFSHSPLTFSLATAFRVRGSITPACPELISVSAITVFAHEGLVGSLHFPLRPTMQRCALESNIHSNMMWHLKPQREHRLMLAVLLHSQWSPLYLPLKQEQTVMIYSFSTFYLSNHHVLIWVVIFCCCFSLVDKKICKAQQMSQTWRAKGSSWPLDKMDWAVLQEIGMINPSLNMNLNELILGILVLMYVLTEKNHSEDKSNSFGTML